MVKVAIPATSANIGAGFDSLGLAVTLYNYLHIDEYEGLVVRSLDNVSVPTGEGNMVFKSAKDLFAICGRPFRGLIIEQISNIPFARGLGSSSACIVGGLLAANRLMGDPLTKSELINLAASIEGHPDNTTPAFLGGFVTSVLEDGCVHCIKQEIRDDLAFMAIVPDFPLKTSAAREVLPKEIKHSDGVYNLSRAALMAVSIITGQYENLAVASGDRMHQPMRMPLMPGADRIMDECERLGAYCSYISGAGSTIMAIIKGADLSFEADMRRFLDRDGKSGWGLLPLRADNFGARIV